MGTLFRRLTDMGFTPVLGTIEKGKPVGLGTPYTYDVNNGIVVVYDGGGQPWLIASRVFDADTAQELIDEFSLTRGAGVPHSNDGGKYLHEVLLKGQEEEHV